MIVEVQHLMRQSDKRYPYNFRVAFYCNLHEAERVDEWIEENKIEGRSWMVTPGYVLYTKQAEAMLCALKWS